MNRPVPERLAQMVETGQLGRKSGHGFYGWEDGRAVKPASDWSGDASDIEDRLILPMVNEAVACLHDGIVSDGDLLDAGVIFGTGFAPFRGGPLNYARERGVQEIIARLDEFTDRYGERFTPHEGFARL
jgi:3-hydroxyacyl-CoA dehydrogenase/enoyl-CoA hydratase/3-hydroxybutyryl-CoA epimerase